MRNGKDAKDDGITIEAAERGTGFG